MLYASSKDALKKALTGINDEYQATESASWLIRLAGSSRAHMARRPPEPPCSFERPRAPSLGRLAHQTPLATPQASVASTQPQLACQRAVGGLAAAFCSGPVA